MLLGFIGIFLFCLRPLLAEELRHLQIPIAGFLWLIILLYSAVLIPRSAVPYDARIEFIKVASYVAAYWAWTELASRQGRWRILLGLMIFAVTIMAWYAVIQQAHGSRMVLNLERPEVYGMRASGTYFCPNHFANVMELLIPMCLALVFIRAAEFPLRLLAGYALFLFLPVMFLTQSRSGWIAMATGLATTVLLLALRKSRRIFGLMLVVLPTLAGIITYSAWHFSPMVRERIAGISLSAPDSAVNARLMMWHDIMPMIKDAPLLGFGPGSFQWVYPPYKTNIVQLLFNYAHNEYLHWTVDYGLIGLGLMLLLLIWGAVRLLRLLLAAESNRCAFLIAGFLGSVVAALSHAFFDFNFHIFSNTHVLILLAGVVMASLYAAGELRPVPIPAPRCFMISVPLAVGAMALALATLQVFLSYGLHFLGDEKRQIFQMPRAMELYRIAARIDPGNWKPYMGMGHVLEAQSFWNLDSESKKEQARKAIRYYEDSLARNRYEMDAVIGESKALTALGEPDKGLALLRRAAEYDRHHIVYLTELGLQLRQMKRYQEALDIFRRAQALRDDEVVRLNIQYLQDKLAAPKPVVP